MIEKPKKKRLRRSRSLIFYWNKGDLFLENYLVNQSIIIDPQLIQILDHFDEYTQRKDVIKKMNKIPDSKKLIEFLIKEKFLVYENSQLDKKENKLNSWKWKINAKYFHYSVQHTRFQGDPEKQLEKLSLLYKKQNPPSPFKNYPFKEILLDSKFNKKSEFWRNLASRRSIREYSRQKISKDNLSDILLWTWGKSKYYPKSSIGPFIQKTSPSGGSRHPTEVYPVVLRVEGIKNGLYHYSVQKNSLELLKPGNFEKKVLNLCSNQPWIKDASVVFFMTSMVKRNMWKYNQSHAYKIILIDVGHLGQTFHLVCTKLGLAPFTHAATNDKQIEKFLGIDGVNEIPIYTAVVGKKKS